MAVKLSSLDILAVRSASCEPKQLEQWVAGETARLVEEVKSAIYADYYAKLVGKPDSLLRLNVYISLEIDDKPQTDGDTQEIGFQNKPDTPTSPTGLNERR